MSPSRQPDHVGQVSMFLLAFDTSTPIVTAALVRDDTLVSDGAFGDITGPQLHGEELASLIADVMEGYEFAELDGIAVGTGPGPYTGLRVGLVTAEVIGHVHGLPVFGVPSLDAIANAHRRHGTTGRITAITDVKRKEFAIAEYGDGDHPLDGPKLVPTSGYTLDGTPSAIDVALVAIARAQRGEHQPVTPIYLRQPDVTLS